MLTRAMIAAGLLTVVLGALEYRWIGQLREAERQRLQGELRASAIRFSQDFNGELARAFSALQAGRPEEGGDDLEEVAGRISGWMGTSPYRRLARGLFRARGGDDGLAELLQFDADSESFKSIAWPARLAELRGRLSARARDLRGGGPPHEDGVEEDVPALIAARPAGPPREQGFVVGGWSIAELDLDYLQKELFPELARKHFGEAFEATVVSRADTERVVFGEHRGGAADAVAPLLNLRPRQGQGRPRPGFGPPGRRPPAPFEGENPPPPGGEGHWQLQVRHRTGSLDSLLDTRWRRELALSFAVLLLLAASMALVLVSARRANRLAHQQMEFVAGVSHELRTPLAVITSAADNLAEGVVATEGQVKKYGSVIRNESRRLTEMVEHLLRFSGLQSGRAQYKLEPVDVQPAVERVLAGSKLELAGAGMEVSVEIEPDLPPAMADRAALGHVLGNLVSNAIKHARSGKWIGVSARRAAIGEAAVEIRVEDHGPGIDAAELENIFEPFYRGRHAVAEQVKGAGLGLSLVKRMVEAQGGTVTVTSKAGEGAQFVLRLPQAMGDER